MSYMDFSSWPRDQEQGGSAVLGGILRFGVEVCAGGPLLIGQGKSAVSFVIRRFLAHRQNNFAVNIEVRIIVVADFFVGNAITGEDDFPIERPFSRR